MASNIALGRHRAEVVKTSPISTLTKAVSSNVGGVGRQAAVIAAASGLVLTSGIAANASTPTVERASDGATTLNMKAGLAPTITAASTVKIAFATPAITSTPAPVVEAPVVVEAKNTTPNNNVAAPAAAAAAKPAAALAAAPAAPAAAVSVQTPAAPAPKAVQSGIGATIASSALAQIGVAQDCTRLASNALAAAGINHHGWPASYLSLGRTVSAAEAQPGDLIYYADGGMGMAHIAVYIGGGKAVHGGWGGGTTAVFSANVGSGPVFIAMGH